METFVENFTKYRNTDQLVPFWKRIKEEEWDVLVLVTRKGYWIYQLLADSYEEVRIEEKPVYSDRYLTKALDRSFLNEKKVCLVDDTMSSGRNLFRFFCVLKKEGITEIVPYVYALNTEFPQDNIWESLGGIYSDVFGVQYSDAPKEVDAFIQDYLKRLRCYRYLSPANMTDVCLKETELFQNTLCPMVIDLPMLVSRQENGNVLKDSFKLSKTQFHNLCEGNENWTYIENVYGGNENTSSADFIKGRLHMPVQCNYFEYQDDTTRMLCNYFLESLVVKCKYRVDEDQNYYITFTPFAIVRSFEKKDLLKLFEHLFKETKYKEKVEECLNKEDNEFIWNNILRSVIYALSLYVGQKFQLLLSSFGINQSGYDWIQIGHNSEELFVDTIKNLKVSDDMLRDIADSYTKEDSNHGTIQFLRGQNTYRASKAYEDICHLVRKTTEEKEKGKEKFTDVEEIKTTLRDKYYFRTEEDLKRKTVNLILLMLEISVIGNYIQVTEDKVERLFRHGENSELLLSDDGMLSYVCAEVIYIASRGDEFDQYFDEFYQEMNCYLKENQFFENGFSEDFFEKNMDYYKTVPREELHMKIMGKKFLLEYMDDQMDAVHNKAIDVVEQLMGGE
jgi:hypothetical protein